MLVGKESRDGRQRLSVGTADEEQSEVAFAGCWKAADLITDTGLEMEMDAQRSLSSSKQRYRVETRIEEINGVRHRS